jgi:predicted ATPase/class 3 adenylate cyclase
VAVGALTFLFTDIEASTRRWEADPQAMSGALADHDAILKRSVTDAGGTVFKHTGDGICAVFPSAAPALAGALTAQRRLSGGPLRVRIAVHSGDVEERDGDYFGPTLNRVARLLAAAWGGQTLVSGATAELAGGRLPAGSTLVELGVHRLADLSRPERILQLNGEALDTAFPPLRTFSVRRSNLPATLTRFVGRETELAEIVQLLSASRLVTLTGVGGAGKTRLGIEAARRLADGFPDGVFFVDLATVVDPALVSAAVAAGLELMLDQTGTLTDQLAAYLERRVTLVVLDNCEHVVAAAAAVVDTLIRRAPSIVVLATSREPLGIPGETVWRVPSLTVADAIDLICDRARSAQPGFCPGPEDQTALERICSRLDGIPLAIELAAARLHLLSPADVARRLDDRFRLLTGGARTAVDRHRTLQATIDWGHDLLDEPSRALLRRLSVFAGSFDVESAEAVGGANALDLLGDLVDRSWVAVEPRDGARVRYRLIETIRQYAADKLAQAGEADKARAAHHRRFATLAEHRGEAHSMNPAGLARVRLDEDNFRAALEWALEAHDRDSSLELASAMIAYLGFTGRGGEARDYLQRALAMEPSRHDRRTITAMWLLGAFLPLVGEARGAERVLTEALQLAESGNSPQLMANIRTSLARHMSSQDPDRAAMLLADPDPAETQRGEADGLERTAGEPTLRIGHYTTLNRGWVALAAGDLEAAEQWFDRAQQRAEGDTVLFTHAAAPLAAVLAARGQSGRAAAMADQAVEAARTINLPVVRVMALTRAAEASILLGRPAKASESLAESSRILRDVGTSVWVGDTLNLVAIIAAHRGIYPAAARLLGAAGRIDAMTGSPFRPLAPRADLAANRARTGLGDQRFSAEHTVGAELTTDEALTLALTTALGHPAETETGPGL